MIPIPRAGVYRRVEGIEAARFVPGIEDVVMTARADQRLVPLPEGASYLGFIFARAGTPAEVERARCAAPTPRSLHHRPVSARGKRIGPEDVTLRQAQRRPEPTRRARTREPQNPRTLLTLLRHVAGRQRGARAERTPRGACESTPGLPSARHQWVLVEDHLLAILPELPCLGRHASGRCAGPARQATARSPTPASPSGTSRRTPSGRSCCRRPGPGDPVGPPHTLMLHCLRPHYDVCKAPCGTRRPPSPVLVRTPHPFHPRRPRHPYHRGRRVLHCAHPMFFPVIGYEFDIRNCEGCDVFKPRRQPGSQSY